MKKESIDDNLEQVETSKTAGWSVKNVNENVNKFPKETNVFDISVENKYTNSNNNENYENSECVKDFLYNCFNKL